MYLYAYIYVYYIYKSSIYIRLKFDKLKLCY
jgi:hypothetical protein